MCSIANYMYNYDKCKDLSVFLKPRLQILTVNYIVHALTHYIWPLYEIKSPGILNTQIMVHQG